MGQTRGYLAQDLLSSSTRCQEKVKIQEYTITTMEAYPQEMPGWSSKLPWPACVLQHIPHFSFVNLSIHASDPCEILSMTTLDRIVFHSLLMHCVNNQLLLSRLLPPPNFSQLSLLTLTLRDGIDSSIVVSLCCTCFYRYLPHFFGFYVLFRKFSKQHQF